MHQWGPSASKNYCAKGIISLLWRHNGPDGVSNHQHRDCLLNRLFRRRSKKTSKLRVTNEFPAQRVSNAENVSIWWRHHVKRVLAKTPRHDRQVLVSFQCCQYRPDAYLVLTHCGMFAGYLITPMYDRMWCAPGKRGVSLILPVLNVKDAHTFVNKIARTSMSAILLYWNVIIEDTVQIYPIVTLKTITWYVVQIYLYGCHQTTLPPFEIQSQLELIQRIMWLSITTWLATWDGKYHI